MSTSASLHSSLLPDLRAFVAAGFAVLGTAAAQPFAPLVGGHLGLSRGDPLLPEIQALLVGDVDGDGARDVVALGVDTSMVCRNDRAGALVVGQRLASGRSLRCGALVDLDGDGAPDLIAAEGSDLPSRAVVGLVCQFRNQGGTFVEVTAQRMPTVRWNSAALVAFDHDRDGDTDLLVATSYDGLQVLDNVGGGTFALATADRLPAGLPSFDATLLRAADFDRDGDVDVLASSLWHSVARVYLRNDGAGRFTLDTAAIPGNDPVRGVVDLDGDGDLDLVRRTTVLVNDGSGGFASRPSGVTIEAAAVAAADLDGDGRTDLLGTSFLHGALPRVFLAQPGGSFAPAAMLPPELVAEEAARPDEYWTGAGLVAVLDVDGDGRPDVVSAGWEGHRKGGSWTIGLPPKLLFNRDGRELVDGSRRTLPYLRRTGLDILAGDFGRGLPDIFSAGRSFVNRGDGTFADGSAGPTGDPGQGVLADLDTDGDLDLVLSTASGRYWLPGTVLLQLHQGGAWATAPLPIQDYNVAAIAAGDVDRDGDVDLVLGRFDTNGSQNRLLLNDGSARFVEGTVGRLPGLVENTYAVLLRDVDGDLDLDLVTLATDASSSMPLVRVLRNDGTGAFAAAAQHPVPGPVRAVVAIDVDRDGDVDLVVSGSVVSPGTTLRNDGTGTFSAVANGFAGFDHLVDLDGTWTAVSAESGRVVVGTEEHRWCWSQDHVALPVDVDLDGDLDVVVSSILGPYRPYHFGMVHGVLFNLRQHLFAPRLARLGLPWLLEVQARAPGGVAAVLVGVAELAPRLHLWPFGWLGVDAAAAFMLPPVLAGTAPAPATIALPVPADAGLLGVPVFAQALIVPATGNAADARLTGVVHDRIGR